MSVSQSPESESQSPNPAGDESGQINRPTKAETLRRRAAYAFGNLGQSAFYNALSTYFVVYVTSVLFVNVEKALATKLIALITSLIVIIRIAEIFLDPLLGNLVDNTNPLRPVPPVAVHRRLGLRRAARHGLHRSVRAGQREPDLVHRAVRRGVHRPRRVLFDA